MQGREFACPKHFGFFHGSLRPWLESVAAPRLDTMRSTRRLVRHWESRIYAEPLFIWFSRAWDQA
jgi:hypothetical protein